MSGVSGGVGGGVGGGVTAPAAPGSAGGAEEPTGLEVHAWLHHCGLACGLSASGCTEPGKLIDNQNHGRLADSPALGLQLCAHWLHHSSWNESPLPLLAKVARRAQRNQHYLGEALMRSRGVPLRS
eukprot:4214977-Prymnesium_polylepis.1